MATLLLLQLPEMGGSGLVMLLQLALFGGIIYFLLIRPQRQEQKRHREMVASLERGDQVVTLGGLVGEILHVKDDLITLKTGDARVTVERIKITRRVGPPSTVLVEK